MALLRTCAAEGCSTKTLGDFCLEHEPVAVLVEGGLDDDDDGPDEDDVELTPASVA